MIQFDVVGLIQNETFSHKGLADTQADGQTDTYDVERLDIPHTQHHIQIYATLLRFVCIISIYCDFI